MARVTVEDCLDKIENRFELVLIASHRAKQMLNGSNSKIDPEGSKPDIVALREIAGSLTDRTVLEEPVMSESTRERNLYELMQHNRFEELSHYDEDDDFDDTVDNEDEEASLADGELGESEEVPDGSTEEKS